MINKCLAILFCLAVAKLYSQPSTQPPLRIGDKVPDVLLANITKYKASTGKLSDFRGKLVILDFWDTYCSTCMAAFPKMEKLQQKFSDRVKIIMVNSNENEKQINERLAQINKSRAIASLSEIKLPEIMALSGDSKFRTLFPHQGRPHHVWIDSAGRVLAITYDYYATAENVQQVLDNKKVKFEFKDDFTDYIMKRDGLFKPVLSSLKPIFYSGFTRFSSLSNEAAGVLKDTANGVVRVNRPNNTIYSLFRTAFMVPGKNTKAIFEVENWGPFDWPSYEAANNAWMEKNLFSYELCVPMNCVDKIYRFMQDDLNRFFGNLYGIEGKMETRKMNCLVLIQTKKGLLKTNGGKTAQTKSNNAYSFVNYPFRSLSVALENYLQNMQLPLAYIDETGFSGNVDMVWKGDMRDIQNAKIQLQQYGLDIIEAERDVEVLVIKERKDKQQ